MGFSMERARLALLLALSVPMLVGVAHRIGFEASFGWREDLRDAFLALGIGGLASAAILALFGLLTPQTSLDDAIGKVALQSVPAAFGALLARSQFGPAEDEDDEDEDEGEGEEDAAGHQALSGHFGSLFLMLIGGVFLSLNVAPTEEMVLISYLMTPWHAVGLVVLSVLVMHGFIFSGGFAGGVEAGGRGAWSLLGVTLSGYALALVVSFYVLWTFSRLDDLASMPALMATVVLAFPASVGAAAARLIL
jgi:putative integral membrane protein (TIGR02587 family)